MTSPRKNEIKLIVVDVLQTTKISTLPIVLDYIIDNYNFLTSTYSEIYHISPENISKDGYIEEVYLDGETYYNIVYNEKMLHQRIRWTIAHECGHYFLDHYKKFAYLTYDEKESECNYFAEQLLTPIAVLSSYGAKREEDIQKLCNISKKAVQLRMPDLQRHLNYKSRNGFTHYDKLFLKQYKDMYLSEFADFLYIA